MNQVKPWALPMFNHLAIVPGSPGIPSQCSTLNQGRALVQCRTPAGVVAPAMPEAT